MGASNTFNYNTCVKFFYIVLKVKIIQKYHRGLILFTSKMRGTIGYCSPKKSWGSIVVKWEILYNSHL